MGESALLTTLCCIAVGGVIGGIANCISVASTGGSARDCALGALAGFVGGVAGAGVATLMVMGTVTAPYAEITGRVVATLTTDFCTSWFINGKPTKEDMAYMAVDVTMDVVFSTITYGYNPIDPVQKSIRRSVVNATVDGVVDIGQNELFNSKSTTSRNSINSNKSTASSKPTVSNNSTSRNRNTAKNYAHQKVGRLIGAI